MPSWRPMARTGNLRCRSRSFDCSLLSSPPQRNEVRRGIPEFKMNPMVTCLSRQLRLHSPDIPVPSPTTHNIRIPMVTLPRLQLLGKTTQVQKTIATCGSVLKLPTIVLKLPPIKEIVGIFNKVEMCPEVRDQNLQYGAYYTSKSHNTQYAY